MPDKPIVIAGENDLASVGKPGGNVGKKFALEAAKAVSGVAVFPIFAPGEAEREGKGFTDFNDLATKSVLGKEAVGNQIGAVVEMLIEQAKAGAEKAETLEQKEEKQTQRQGTLNKNAAVWNAGGAYILHTTGAGALAGSFRMR